MNVDKTRIETDSFGLIEVPAAHYWGVVISGFWPPVYVPRSPPPPARSKPGVSMPNFPCGSGRQGPERKPI